MMEKEQLITICTATYNRAELLHVLYNSLKAQTNLHFEWILIDDGSTDTTTQVISEMQAQAPFDIVYHKQENQGKHIAINKGVAMAKGTYFFIVDSDDRLPEEAITIIVANIKNIKNDPEIAGVVGLKCNFNQQVVGSDFLSENVICDIFEYRYTHKINGDRAEVFKTAILKKYPFPKFENEKFIPESIVWNRIGQNYKMLFFNKNVYECEYLEDGLSAQSVFLRRKYPKGIIHLYAELGTIAKIGLLNRYKAYVNFWRFFFCDPRSRTQNIRLLKKQYAAFLCMPLGLFFYVKDHFSQKSDS